MELSDIFLIAVAIVIAMLLSLFLLEWYRADVVYRIGMWKHKFVFLLLGGVVLTPLLTGLAASIAASDADANGEDFSLTPFIFVGAFVSGSILFGMFIALLIAIGRRKT